MIEIHPLEPGRRLGAFLDVVDDIYAGDPAYVRPLDMDLKDRLSPKKNPFFEHGEAALFVAFKNGRCVGRISASIDREHLERYQDATGFWGFLDTVEDQEVASALLGHAEKWLHGKGMKQAKGPISVSINEEVGCLVEGFDTPPYIMMPHHRPYQHTLIEKAGYAKAKDFYAWSYVVGDLPARVRKAQEEIRALPEVTARCVSYADMERDVATVMDIFNDAWSENWGFVPLTQKEVRKVAQDFKLILIPEITRIVSIEGQAAAVAVAIPNINELARDLHGKLFPLGLPKLLWRLKVRGPKTARVLILGIRRRYRHVRRYAALSAYLYGELNESGRKIGMKAGEFGWTLEDNGAVNAGIRLMGAHLYKKYRVYQKPLAS